MTEMDSDHLTPQQREAIRALPRERDTPRALEDRVVAELRSRGLVRSSRGRGEGRPRHKMLLSVGAALAASIILFTAGFQLGGRGAARSMSTPSPHYLLLLYQDASFRADSVPERDLVDQYRAWATALRREGRLLSAEKLQDSGVLLHGSVDAGMLEHVPQAAEGIVSGYFVIAANGYEQAVSIARSSPHLRHGGRISVREIDPT